MQFRLGPAVYRVQITDGPIIDGDGTDLLGECDWAKREVRLSGAMPAMRRLEVLAHELRHAWVNHCGRARSSEEDANNVASFFLAVYRDLLRQGGEPALQRMSPGSLFTEPAPDVQDDLWDAAGQVNGAECGVCSTRFSASNVITGHPVHDERLNKLVVVRSLFCEHCAHVQEWREGCTNSGTPNGQVVTAPEYKRGRAVAQFLQQHGARIGIAVA
jgi:hypothetical protein